jgi:YHS domain-containing protein
MNVLSTRRSRWIGTLALLSITLIPAVPYLAGAHSDHAHPEGEATPVKKEEVKAKSGPEIDPYLLGIDPVSGKPLGPLATQVVTSYKGRELRFASQKSLDLFLAAPEKYLPGLDRKMIAEQLSFYPLTTCMVSGDALGGEMGTPVDFLHGNRLVRLCCKSCVKKFDENRAGFLSAIDKAVIESRKAAYKTTTCVVSGEKLGSMGDPVDLVVGNRLVRLCCSSCVKTFAADAVAFMAKLPAPAAATGSTGSK